MGRVAKPSKDKNNRKEPREIRKMSKKIITQDAFWKDTTNRSMGK